MDYVQIGACDSVRDGLRDMMVAACDGAGLVNSLVDPSTALFIIECAKRAEDKDAWFPHGQWATIQAIQAGVDKELVKLFKEEL